MISKSKKIMLSTLLALTLLFSMTGVVNAKTNLTPAVQPPVAIQPYWSQTSAITIGLSFDGGKGTLSYSVLGNSGTTKITGVAVLERLNSNGTYSTVYTWTGISINSDYLPWNSTYYVSTGYTYRFTFTCTVYRNGTTETISAYYSNTAY